MAYKWKNFAIRRFYGVDKKTNPVDVKDGLSLDLINTFQDEPGVIRKRNGNKMLFSADEATAVEIDEVGTCVLGGTRYYYQFSGGDFQYATTETGAKTNISPSPAISTTNQIWCAVLDDKLFFVDGTNNLRFFDGTAIFDSTIAERPTGAITTADGGTGFDYYYTMNEIVGTYNLGESPLSTTMISNKSGTVTATIAGPIYGSRNIMEGDIFRIYRRATGIAAASLLVAEYTATAADETGNTLSVATTSVTPDSLQLYTELGLAINKTAPTALIGITNHYGRLVGWKDSKVYCSKVSNPHSFPDEQAVREAFVYGFSEGDGEDIARCQSYRESLFVFKKTNVAIFVGFGPDDSGGNAFAFRRLEVNGNGCVAPKSVVTVGQEGNTYLIFLSNNGFYATNGNEPVNIGDNVEPDLKSYSENLKSLAVAFHDKRYGHYVCFIGSSTQRIGYALSVHKDKDTMVGWFVYNSLQYKCISYDDSNNKYLAGTYLGYSVSQRVTETSSDLSDVFLERVDPTSVNTGTEEITVTKSYQTGDEIVFRSTGGVPAGLTANTIYYAIRISATVIKVATSPANATAGTAINLTTQGTGIHTVISKVAIDGYYTTNWFNFGTTSYVKKLAKASLIFNAKVSTINIDVSFAYDWFDSFSAPINVSINSTNAWGDDPWGDFEWGAGAVAVPKNLAIPRRKIRSIRYKFRNSNLDQDLNLQGFEQAFSIIRNRGNFAA